MHYLLKSRGKYVLYLGQEISLADLADANRIHKADLVFTMITETFSKESVQQYVDHLAETFPGTRILLSGYQVVAQQVDAPEHVTILKSLDQMLRYFDQY